ncbi:ABC transporter permease [Paenibacillus alkalitolerans]|uniref:ABC transporter permease n=1 Tax=Paenibacillus alkalitolerans TaxID=2799335 RepID=UPI001F355B18|nr:ABC transporter permease subunit [Paenibacillus alkalitolerans]
MKNKYLYLLILPGFIFIFIFEYLPLFGLVIAFQDFNAVKGIMGSEFVGLKNFEFFFQSKDWLWVTFNTVYLNLLFLAFGTIAAIAIAVMLSEIGNKWFKKTSQSVVILPHFISWTVVSMFTMTLFSSDGLINVILTKLGVEPVSFYSSPGIWPLLLVLLTLWHGAGFSSIVYLATITGIDPSIYESASIDGASRWQKIWHITLPLLKPTMILLILLALGNIFYGNFGMIYAIVGSNPLLYPTTDVIDTFVYRALMELGDMGMSSAVGFYQSLVGFFLVLTANYAAKKLNSDSALF